MCVCLIFRPLAVSKDHTHTHTHEHTHTHTCPRGVKAIQWSISSYWCVKTIREMEEDEKSIHPTVRERERGGRASSVMLKKPSSLSVGGFTFNKRVSSDTNS